MAYFQDRCPVLKSQYELICKLTEGLNSDVVKFFKHVLACTFIQAKDLKGWIPVSAALIRKEAPKAESPAWQALVEKELLFSTEASLKDGKSRLFHISSSVIEEFRALDPLGRQSPESYVEYQAIPKVNLFTGYRVIKQKSATTINGNELPPLIADAIRTFKTCYYDRLALEQHLERMLGTCIELCNCPPDLEGHDCKAYYRLLNDEFCRSHIENRQPIWCEKLNAYAFEPYYVPTSTGRITSPLQSATREMKYAMYRNLGEMRNYDLKSSQAVILQQEFGKAGISSNWLNTYLSTENAKEVYALKAGLEGQDGEATWKNCLYALFMGAGQPRQTEDPNGFYSVEAYLYNYLGDKSQLEGLYEQFNELVKPLCESIEEWHSHLIKDYAKSNSTRSGDKFYVPNACGMKFCFKTRGKKKTNKTKRDLAAHILQGQEACFIHHLTLLGKKYNYKPIGNEHDGLIVLGEIPNEAIQEAVAESGMPPDVEFPEKENFNENSHGLLVSEDWFDLPPMNISL